MATERQSQRDPAYVAPPTIVPEGRVNEFLAIFPLRPDKFDWLKAQVESKIGDPRRWDPERTATRSAIHSIRFTFLRPLSGLLVATEFDGGWYDYIESFANETIRLEMLADLAECIDPAWGVWPAPGDIPASLQVFDRARVHASDFGLLYEREATLREINRALRIDTAVQKLLDNPKAEQLLADPAFQDLLEAAQS